MKRRLSRFGMCVAVTLLAGCGSAQMPNPGSVAIGPSQSQTLPAPGPPVEAPPPHVLPPPHTNHPRSWTGRREAKSMLLYVSDWSTNGVYSYDYDSGERLGELTGFDEPYGQCVDTQGDIYITNYGNGKTIEYAHGGTSPLNTFTSPGLPFGCSVDKNGDLAVTSFDPGSITVFARGQSQGTTYTNNACKLMWPAGYDDKGNLYALGESSIAALGASSPYVRKEYDVSVCALTAGSGVMSVVGLSGANINSPGSVMWDGEYITLTDQAYMGSYDSGVYQTTETSSGGLEVVGSTDLGDSCYSGYSDIEQPFLVGKKNTPDNHREGSVLVAVNVSCAQSGVSAVDFWQYPAGGDPFKHYNDAAHPTGVSVSIGN